MSEELITPIINKNKKKFKPKAKQRRIINTPAIEEEKHTTTIDTPEEESIVPQQTNNKNYLESLLLSPEEYKNLIQVYPKEAKKVSRLNRRPLPEDYIPSNLPTAEDRQKQARVAQEAHLTEYEKFIESSKTKKRLRDGEVRLSESALAPQVKVVEGKIVLDKNTLKVSRSAPNYRDVTTELLFEGKEVKKQFHWTKLETQVFYDGLSLYGLNFQRIADTLVGRDKTSVTLKFRKEEDKYPEKIAKYLFAKPNKKQKISNDC